MSLPQIFLSSTCYDLSSVRSSLTAYLEGYGFGVLNSENKKFPVTPKSHSHNACLDQVKYADYLVLIIGGRRGGNYIGSENTITNEEYQLASKLGIPIIAFVDKAVNSQIVTYRKNPQADFSHVVDDTKIFDFISYVSSGHEDNWLHEYSSANEIQEVLRTQFSYYLKLFSQSLRPNATDEKEANSTKFVAFPSSFDNLPSEFTSQEEKTAFRDGSYAAHAILSKIISSDIKIGSKDENLKAIWLMARYAEFDGYRLKLKNDAFKSRAWSITKGKRVFNQLAEFGVQGHYDEDYDSDDIPEMYVFMAFKGNCDGEMIACAFQELARALLSKHEEKAAMELFKRADFRIFS